MGSTPAPARPSAVSIDLPSAAPCSSLVGGDDALDAQADTCPSTGGNPSIVRPRAATSPYIAVRRTLVLAVASAST